MFDVVIKVQMDFFSLPLLNIQRKALVRKRKENLGDHFLLLYFNNYLAYLFYSLI